MVFCETGLVVTPFLPGDSLLFAVGALAAMSGSPLDIWLVIGLLIVAAGSGGALGAAVEGKGPEAMAEAAKAARATQRSELEERLGFLGTLGSNALAGAVRLSAGAGPRAGAGQGQDGSGHLRAAGGFGDQCSPAFSLAAA